MFKIKKRPTDKPDFVSRSPKSCEIAYHLSTSNIADELYLPTLRVPRAAGCSDLKKLSRNVSVYLAFQPTRFIPLSHCCETLCALTAHFHPYPKAVIFCDTLCLSADCASEIPPVRWCGCSTLSGLSSLPIARYRDRLVGNSDTKIGKKGKVQRAKGKVQHELSLILNHYKSC